MDDACSCAASTASAICFAIGDFSSGLHHAPCAPTDPRLRPVHDQGADIRDSSRPWIARCRWLRDAAPRFALEPRESSGSDARRSGRTLIATSEELRVAGAVDLPHATFADLRGDFVDAETRARRQRH